MFLLAGVAWLSGRGEVPKEFSLGLPDFDKLVHFAVFGLVALLFARIGGRDSRKFGWSLAGLLAAVLFGLGDEVLQGHNPHRSGFDVADWLADVAGAVTAITLWRGWDLGHRLLEAPLRLPGGLFRNPARRAPVVPVSPPILPVP